MRKQTKLVAVASAAALLAIGASMTSFAATGWVEEDGQWYYYNKDGSRAEDEWKKSGNNWYWLDSENGGAMATDKLIDDNNNTYYVDSNGVMVTSTWVKIVNEDQDEDTDPAEYRYYYMQSNGKAYGFDQYGVMLYEWNNIVASGSDASASNWGYFRSPEDGARVTKGWFKVIAPEKDEEWDK